MFKQQYSSAEQVSYGFTLLLLLLLVIAAIALVPWVAMLFCRSVIFNDNMMNYVIAMTKLGLLKVLHFIIYSRC